VADRHRTAGDILGSCDNRHCQALYQYHEDNGIHVDQLGYEDVFYPLRHHHRDGLALKIEWGLSTDRLVWGPGDLIYRASDDTRTMETAVDTAGLWTQLNHDRFEAVTLTVLEADATEAP